MKKTIHANGITRPIKSMGPSCSSSRSHEQQLDVELGDVDDTIVALTAHYRVVRYDTRGHGQSEVTPGPYSIELLANDLVGLMDACRLRKPI